MKRKEISRPVKEKHWPLYLLWRNSEFICFQHGGLLVTDQYSLQYPFKEKYMHGRLARWMDFLAEYDFEVKY